MKIYTKKGDLGTTSIIGENNVNKNNIRIEAYGTVDELNSYLGLFSSCINKKKSARGRPGASPVTTHERVPSMARTRSVGRSRARSVGRSIDRGGCVRMRPRVVTRAACASQRARGTRRWASVGPRGDRPGTGHRASRASTDARGRRRARATGDGRRRRVV